MSFDETSPVFVLKTKLDDLRQRRLGALAEREAHLQRLNQEWVTLQEASNLAVAELEKEITKTEGVIEYLSKKDELLS